jgi:hypothetical protein
VAVNPGDSIVASVSDSSTGAIATAQDYPHASPTHPYSIQANDTTPAPSCLSSSACDEYVFIGDIGGAELRDPTTVPSFGTIKFTNVTIDSLSLGSWSPNRANLKSGRDIQIAAGTLSKPCGNSFTLTFKNNT